MDRKSIIIGAGAMGLTTALELLKKGYDTTDRTAQDQERDEPEQLFGAADR